MHEAACSEDRLESANDLGVKVVVGPKRRGIGERRRVQHDVVHVEPKLCGVRDGNLGMSVVVCVETDFGDVHGGDDEGPVLVAMNAIQVHGDVNTALNDDGVGGRVGLQGSCVDQDDGGAGWVGEHPLKHDFSVLRVASLAVDDGDGREGLDCVVDLERRHDKLVAEEESHDSVHAVARIVVNAQRAEVKGRGVEGGDGGRPPVRLWWRGPPATRAVVSGQQHGH